MHHINPSAPAGQTCIRLSLRDLLRHGLVSLPSLPSNLRERAERRDMRGLVTTALQPNMPSILGAGNKLPTRGHISPPMSAALFSCDIRRMNRHHQDQECPESSALSPPMSWKEYCCLRHPRIARVADKVVDPDEITMHPGGPVSGALRLNGFQLSLIGLRLQYAIFAFPLRHLSVSALTL